VLDDYERNCKLIDLNAQPDEIKQAVDSAIREQIRQQDIGQVGVRFMRFCAKFDLAKISESAEQYGKWLNQPYPGALTNA
jgi:hypothetical protein